MSARAVSRAAQFGALARDAVIELRARRLFWVGVALALVLLGAANILIGSQSSMSISVNGQTRTAQGAASIAAIVLPGFVQFLALAALMITLFGLNGVIASVTDRGTAEVYVSKPVPRWLLLCARLAGYWCAVMVAVTAIVALLWALAGVRTGAWSPRVFAALPAIGLIECVFLVVLALFNVLTGAGGLSGLLAFVLYVVTDALKHHDMLAPMFRAAWMRATIEWGYRVLPKPGELIDAIAPVVRGRGDVPWFAVWTSAAFALVVLAATARAFARKDY